MYRMDPNPSLWAHVDFLSDAPSVRPVDHGLLGVGISIPAGDRCAVVVSALGWYGVGQTLVMIVDLTLMETLECLRAF